MRALQQRARLTPAEAADALCVSVRTYRRWLQHGNPSPTGHIDHGNYGIQDLAQRVVVAR
ncbi:helix-turn-helix domain-containing protein [Thiohalocapsa halophila]|uniref:helix-turn-helix domain-containing protein n=1 Tax=Thiohalocapsa halophila TaxID=69359 RepID=UPI0034DADE0A